jgi:hypothetical protein
MGGVWREGGVDRSLRLANEEWCSDTDREHKEGGGMLLLSVR